MGFGRFGPPMSRPSVNSFPAFCSNSSKRSISINAGRELRDERTMILVGWISKVSAISCGFCMVSITTNLFVDG